MGLSLSLGLNLGSATLNAGGGAVDALRIEPASADLFYLVQRADTGATVVKFGRGSTYGGTGGSNLGSQWPEFRIIGTGTLADFDDVAASATTWQAEEVGAWDFIARNAGGSTLMGSYHGLGAGGSLVSESIEIDGAAADHTEATSGNSFELRNVTTATDGTDTVTRDLSVLSVAGGEIDLTMNDLTITAVSYTRFAMPIASGSGFEEVDARFGTAFNTLPLGSGEATGGLANPQAIRIRNPSNGYFVSMSGTLPSVTGFSEARIEKQVASNRAKGYLSTFTSSFTSLIGSTARLSWGVGATGSASPGTNLVAANWDGWTFVQSNGTVVDGGTDLTMTWSTGTSNLRAYNAISGAQVAEKFAAIMDFVSDSTGVGTKQIYGASSAGGSNTSPAFSLQPPAIGRNVQVFTCTLANQPLAVRNANSATCVTVWRNPAAYRMAA